MLTSANATSPGSSKLPHESTRCDAAILGAAAIVAAAVAGVVVVASAAEGGLGGRRSE